MNLSRLFTAALFMLAAAPMGSTAAEKEDPDKPSTDPKGVPIELKIINLQEDRFEVDTDGHPYSKFQQMLRDAELAGSPLRATSVEMALEIKNTGPAAIKIWVGGDVTLLNLSVKGTGARFAEAKLPKPKGVIPPVVVEIKAGKTHRIPLESLTYGFRNETKYAYITEGGMYELSATFRTGVFPAPAKCKNILQNGFGEVQLKSPTLHLRAVRQT
jgi:hypothetical protein